MKPPISAFVLAAVEGARLRPLTENKPKSMLPVCHRPILEWILRWLRAHGHHSVGINVHYKPKLIPAYFGDGGSFDMRITYSAEPWLRGTAGALVPVRDNMADPFVLVYGDVLTDVDLGRLWEYHRVSSDSPHVTILVEEADRPAECGIVETDGCSRVTRFIEKPRPGDTLSRLANAGVLIINRPLLSWIPEDEPCDLFTTMLPAWIESGVPVFGHRLRGNEYLINTGTHIGYSLARRDWPTERAKHQVGFRDVLLTEPCP